MRDKHGYARALRGKIHQWYGGVPQYDWHLNELAILYPEVAPLVGLPKTGNNAGSEPGAPAQTRGVDWSLFPFIE